MTASTDGIIHRFNGHRVSSRVDLRAPSASRLTCRHAAPRQYLAERVSGLAMTLSFAALVACGKVNLGERKWTCNERTKEGTAHSILDEAELFWDFNVGTSSGGAAGSDEAGSAGSRTEKNKISYIIGSISGVTRLGGEGSAVFTDGNRPAACSKPLDTGAGANAIELHEDVTYSLWVSAGHEWLERDAPARIVMLSTATGNGGCGGHELDLVGVEQGDTHLELWYYDTNCQRVDQPLKSNRIDTLSFRDAWGVGSWHHVAATVEHTSNTVAFFADGAPVPTDTSRATQLVSMAPAAPIVKMVLGSRDPESCGSDGHPSSGSDAGTASPLIFFDDVTIFARALSNDELRQLHRASLSKYRLANLPWATWDSAPSTGSWGSNQGGGLTASCYDQNSSACGAVAIVEDWKLRVADVERLVLNADLPANTGADFIVTGDEQGRQFCKWSVQGVGGALYYFSSDEWADWASHTGVEFEPSNELKWCRCDTCDCDFPVHGATIGSPWTDGIGDYSVRLCGLDYTTREHADASRSTRPKRGTLDSQGWCWRAIALDTESHARLLGESTTGAVRAELAGPENTSAIFAADFGVIDPQRSADSEPNNKMQFRALPVGYDIAFCANLPKGEHFQIHVQSENDGYCEMAIDGEDGDDGSSLYPNNGQRFNEAYCRTWQDQNSQMFDQAGERVYFDPTRVRYLGIQKNWSFPLTPATLRIDSVTLQSNPTFTCPIGH